MAGNLLFELSSHLDLPSKSYTLHLPPQRVFPASIGKRYSPTVARSVCRKQYLLRRSRLFHEGLIYCVGDLGVLTVLDAEKGEIVYRKLLDADVYTTFRGGEIPARHWRALSIFLGIRASAGDRAGQDIQAGREEPRGICIHQPRPGNIMESCPVFEGKRLYYRGTENLYCIEEK